MKSVFDVGFGMGFHNNFMGAGLGQGEEQEWQSLQQSQAAPATTPAAKPATTPATTGGGTDWTKLISQTVTGAAGAVTAYEKEKAATVAKETEKIRQARAPGAPGVIATAGTSPVLIAGLVGVGVLALGAVLIVASKG